MTPGTTDLLIIATAVLVLAFLALALLTLTAWLDTREARRRERVREQMLARELSKLHTRHYRRWGGR